MIKGDKHLLLLSTVRVSSSRVAFAESATGRCDERRSPMSQKWCAKAKLNASVYNLSSVIMIYSDKLTNGTIVDNKKLQAPDLYSNVFAFKFVFFMPNSSVSDICGYTTLGDFDPKGNSMK